MRRRRLPPTAEQHAEYVARAQRGIATRQSRDRTLVPHPAATDRLYSDEEREWLAAVTDYQKRTGNWFPTFTELLALLKQQGYQRAAY